MSNNKVQTHTPSPEYEQPPAEVTPALDASPAINGGDQDQSRPPAKDPVANELITTNQVHEPNLLTDQGGGASEPPNQTEQTKQLKKTEVNPEAEVDADDHSPFKGLEKDVDQPGLATVEGLIEQHLKNIVKVTGI